MHSSFYMLEKELIEHKSVTRIPLFVLLCGVAVFYAMFSGIESQQVVSYSWNFGGSLTTMAAEVSRNLNIAITFVVGLLSLLLSSLYFPKTFRKERQEGSAMFWRSIPISIAQTHSVKLMFGLLVIPAICSLLVLAANLLLLTFNLSQDLQLALIGEQVTFVGAIGHWLEFFGRMVVVAIVLFPLATTCLMFSQYLNSPILIMLIGSYALSWLSVGLFDFYGVKTFFTVILTLPYEALISLESLVATLQTHWVIVLVYALLGAWALWVSMKLYKTNEVSLKHLFSSS